MDDLDVVAGSLSDFIQPLQNARGDDAAAANDDDSPAPFELADEEQAVEVA